MSLQLKVGKTYKARDGSIVTITYKDDFGSSPYPYKGDNGNTYADKGYHDISVEAHEWDLVEEVPTYKEDAIKLEVGKTYKDREGNLVTIVRKNANYPKFYVTYPFIGNNAREYMEDGRFREYDLYHDYDLVEEVSTTPMFGTTWAFPNFKQVVGVPTFIEETKMQDQIVTINCTLVVRDIEGTLTLQVHPKDEFWRADENTTVLDSNFELVLPKAKVEELYTERLLAKVKKTYKDYTEASDAFESAKTFIDSL